MLIGQGDPVWIHMKTLSLIVPVYNEEETLPFTHERLVALSKAPGMAVRLQIVYVDDGSKDGSPMILDRLTSAWERS